jgi:endonuclease YncB( thermonuclease family)
MASRTTLELVPLLASALISAPSWALEACVAVDGDTLRCGHQLVRLAGIHAAERGTPEGEKAFERMQDILRSGRVRLQGRATDRYGRLVADLYVNEVKIQQRHVGPRCGIGAEHRKKGRTRKLKC